MIDEILDWCSNFPQLDGFLVTAWLSDVSEASAIGISPNSTVACIAPARPVRTGTRLQPASRHSSGVGHRSWLPSSWRRRGGTWITGPRMSASPSLTRCFLISPPCGNRRTRHPTTPSARIPPCLFILGPHPLLPFSTAATGAAGYGLSG